MYQHIRSGGVGADARTPDRKAVVLDNRYKMSPDMRFLKHERAHPMHSLPESAVSIERVDNTTHLVVGDIIAYESVTDTGRWFWSIGTILSPRKVDDFGLYQADLYGVILLGSWRVTAEMRREGVPSDRKSKYVLNEDSALANARHRQEEIQNDVSALSRELYVTDVIRSDELAFNAREAIRHVGLNFWNDFYAIKHPQPSVRLAVQAVMTLLRIELLAVSDESEWKQMLRFLRSDAFDAILSGESSVCGLDEGHVQLMTEHFLKNPLFTFDQTSPASHIAGLFQKWVSLELLSYGAREQLASIDERLAELNQEASQLASEVQLHERNITNIQDDNENNDNDDNGDDVEVVKRYMNEKGKITIIRSSETTVTVRSAIFCRIRLGPTVKSGALEALDISKDCLGDIRAAALDKDKRISFGTCATPRVSPRRLSASNSRTGEELSKERAHMEQNSHLTRLLRNASQAEILYEESLRRERLVVLELEDLYQLHVSHTAKFHRLCRRGSRSPPSPSSTSPSPSPSPLYEESILKAKAAAEAEAFAVKRRLVDAQHDVERLEDLLRQRDAALQAARESLEQHVRFSTHDERGDHFLPIHSEEQVSRLRLSADESHDWFTLLLCEQRVGRHRAVANLVHCQKEEVAWLRAELAVREVCCSRAMMILDDCAAEDPRAELGPTGGGGGGPGGGRGGGGGGPGGVSEAVVLREGIRHAQDALRERRSPPPPPPSGPPPRVAAECPLDSLTRRSRRHATPAENETLLRDCLTEALRDREVIQHVLRREQEQRRKLEEKVQELQDQLAIDKDFPERSESSGYIRSLPGSERPSTRYIELLHHKHQQQITTQTSDTPPQDTLLSYNRQLADVLAEEGRRDVAESSTFEEKVRQLRECLAEAHGNSDKMRTERDAQAEDARVLERYLRSAADALESALFHDERWRPRKTSVECTSWHCRVFSGTGWSNIIDWTPETLRRALVEDIAAACHLPEEYVLNLNFRDNGQEMRVSCDIRHDPSISADEITLRLNECNFHQLDKLHATHSQPDGGVKVMEQQVLSREAELRELRERLSQLRPVNVSTETLSSM